MGMACTGWSQTGQVGSRKQGGPAGQSVDHGRGSADGLTDRHGRGSF